MAHLKRYLIERAIPGVGGMSIVELCGAARASNRAIEQIGLVADQSMPASQDHSVRLSQVREAFLSLPEEQRSALHLVAIEGLSYHQAAEVIGVPLGTLMSRIGRARAALREMEEGAPPKSKPHLRIVGDDQ